MRLSDVCTIRTGYTARQRLDPVGAGTLVIQLGDVPAQGQFDPERLIRVQSRENLDRFMVNSGDVLFRSRGERTTALALGTELTEPALALSPLYVLRPDTTVLAPRFLAWTLNQVRAQRHFNASALGTNIRMVPKSSLDSLTIDLPNLSVQNLIGSVDELAERQLTLTHQLADTSRRLVSALLTERAGDQFPNPSPERTTK